MTTRYQPRAVLVTGGAGFIGANFVHYALANDPHITIVNLDKLSYAGSLHHLNDLHNNPRHHFIQGDILDDHLVRHLLQHHHIDTIVHFAAESHVDRSITHPSAFVENNIVGTQVLLEAAKHHWFQVEGCNPADCRFHHISTDEVYGSLQLTDPAFIESTAYAPNSPYSASKAAADHLVNAYFNTFQLPITLSRCSNNYGPFQHAEKFIPTVIRACIEGKPIPIYGNGKNIRDWLHVEDHCRGIMAILKNGRVGESYNMGGNNEWDNLSLAQFICQQIDQLRPQKSMHDTLIQFVTDRAGHDFRYAVNFSKIQKELGWFPQHTFESGIKETIQFYLKDV